MVFTRFHSALLDRRRKKRGASSIPIVLENLDITSASSLSPDTGLLIPDLVLIKILDLLSFRDVFRFRLVSSQFERMFQLYPSFASVVDVNALVKPDALLLPEAFDICQLFAGFARWHGAKVRKISWLSETDSVPARFGESIVRYCSRSLVELHFCRCDSDLWPVLAGKLPNLLKISLDFGGFPVEFLTGFARLEVLDSIVTQTRSPRRKRTNFCPEISQKLSNLQSVFMLSQDLSTTIMDVGCRAADNSSAMAAGETNCSSYAPTIPGLRKLIGYDLDWDEDRATLFCTTFPNLQTLDFARCKFTSLAAFTELANSLSSLTFSDVDVVDDDQLAANLSQLVNLQQLSFPCFADYAPSDFSFLSSLTSLETFRINGCPDFTAESLGFLLASRSPIVRLDISNTGAVCSVGLDVILANWASLQQLHTLEFGRSRYSDKSVTDSQIAQLLHRCPLLGRLSISRLIGVKGHFLDEMLDTSPALLELDIEMTGCDLPTVTAMFVKRSTMVKNGVIAGDKMMLKLSSNFYDNIDDSLWWTSRAWKWF